MKKKVDNLEAWLSYNFQKVLEPLYEENMNENGDLYLDVAEAYMENGYYKYAEPILAKLVKTKNYDLVSFVIAPLVGIFNPFLHEYSCQAPPTVNTHIN